MYSFCNELFFAIGAFMELCVNVIHIGTCLENINTSSATTSYAHSPIETKNIIEETKTCPTCNETLPINAIFCKKCGTQL